MVKTNKINVVGTEITVIKTTISEFISITDIARHKDAAHTDLLFLTLVTRRYVKFT